MIRSATNNSTPPSAASGTWRNSVAPNANSASTIVAANSPDSCVRPPVSDTMPVRGGLALTGNAPNNPASTLPAPAPRKSRSTSAGLSGSDGKHRGYGADHVHALALEAGPDHRGGGADQPDQRAGNFGADRLRGGDHAEYAQPDANRIEVGFAGVLREFCDTIEHRSFRR